MNAALRTVMAVAMALVTTSVEAQILYDGSNYSQDFNSLAASGTGNAWTDNSTLPGWYSSRTTYNAGTGSSTTGGLYSYGASADTDRALGSLATGSATPVQFGLRLQNSTGSTLTGFSLSYSGEQWRVGGVNSVLNSLSFEYKLGDATLADADFTSFAGLSFDSPISSGTAGAVDGNNSAQQQAFNASVTGLDWSPGADLWLRWTDLDNTSSDHGLAVDNLQFSAVPEPEEYGLIAALFLVAIGWWRKLHPTHPLPHPVSPAPPA